MTRLYFHIATDNTSGLPTAEQSSLTVTTGCNFEGSQTTNRQMNTTIGVSQQSVSRVGTMATSSRNYYVTRFVSPPLYQTSISANTWVYAFTASESVTGCNFPGSGNNQAVRVNCYVWRPSNQTKVGTILDGNTAATVDEGSANEQQWHIVNFTGSEVLNMQDGDVIIFEVWFVITSGVATSQTLAFYLDGTDDTYAENATSTTAASYLQTPENLQLTEVQTFQRPVSDSITLSESTTRPLVGRSISETTSISESSSRLATLIRNPSPDTVTLSESTERSLIAPRAAEDSVILSESLGRLATLLRPVSDTTSLSDSATGTFIPGGEEGETFVRNVSDSIGGAQEQITQHIHFLSDSIEISEPVIGRLYTAKRTQEDTTSLSDSILRIKTALRSLSDTANLSESIQTLRTFLREAIDTVEVTESLSRIATFIRNLSDSTILSELVNAIKNPGAQTFVRNVSDTILLSEQMARILTALRSSSDSITLSDTVQKFRTILAQLSDTVTLSDTVQRVFSALRTAEDTITLSDTVQSFKVFLKSVSDTVNLTESIQRLYIALRTAEDTVTTNETIQALRTFTKQVTDIISTSDTVQRFYIFVRTVEDTLSSSDTVQRIASYLRSIEAETITISEAIQTILVPLIPPSIPRIFRRISLRKIKGSGRKIKGLGRQVKGSTMKTKGSGLKIKGSGRMVSSEEA